MYRMHSFLNLRGPESRRFRTNRDGPQRRCDWELKILGAVSVFVIVIRRADSEKFGQLFQ